MSISENGSPINRREWLALCASGFVGLVASSTVDPLGKTSASDLISRQLNSEDSKDNIASFNSTNLSKELNQKKAANLQSLLQIINKSSPQELISGFHAWTYNGAPMTFSAALRFKEGPFKDQIFFLSAANTRISCRDEKGAIREILQPCIRLYKSKQGMQLRLCHYSEFKKTKDQISIGIGSINQQVSNGAWNYCKITSDKQMRSTTSSEIFNRLQQPRIFDILMPANALELVVKANDDGDCNQAHAHARRPVHIHQLLDSSPEQAQVSAV